MKPLKIVKASIFNSKNSALALHVICWACFVLYELAFVYYTTQRFAPFLNYLVYYAVNISLFYSHVALLGFAFGKPKPAGWKSLGLFALQLVFFLSIKSIFDFLFAPVAGWSAKIAYLKVYVFQSLFRCCYFCVLATFSWVAGNIANFRRRADKAEHQQLLALQAKTEMEARLERSKNAYLRQQLNPHMLFNSLNFIHNSVYKHSEEASRCILLLSDILRYTLEAEDGSGMALLSDEIAQVQTLVEINRLRYGGRFYFNLELKGNFKGLKIIPLILITLTENIFKHGHISDKNYPALLTIEVADTGKLAYHTRNRKKNKTETKRRTALGLQNTRLRLDYAYRANHSLIISEDEDNFDLTLNINL